MDKDQDKNKVLKAGRYIVPMADGYLELSLCHDPDFPGIDIEYHTDEHDKEMDNGERVSNPRVVVEFPSDYPNEMHTMIWDDPHSEDYTSKTRSYTEISGPGLGDSIGG